MTPLPVNPTFKEKQSSFHILDDNVAAVWVWPFLSKHNNAPVKENQGSEEAVLEKLYQSPDPGPMQGQVMFNGHMWV